eukprot:XP_020395690.1 spidroin-1-like [Zea mays]
MAPDSRERPRRHDWEQRLTAPRREGQGQHLRETVAAAAGAEVAAAGGADGGGVGGGRRGDGCGAGGVAAPVKWSHADHVEDAGRLGRRARTRQGELQARGCVRSSTQASRPGAGKGGSAAGCRGAGREQPDGRAAEPLAARARENGRREKGKLEGGGGLGEARAAVRLAAEKN